MLPLKTTIEDFDTLGGYLRSQVGWSEIAKVKSTIASRHADNRKLEAGKYIGFLDRDGQNIRLTDLGRLYVTAPEELSKQSAMLEMLMSAELYADTVRWMHFSNNTEPTRTAIGNYWHDHHANRLEGAKGSALTDAAVFFLRVASAAGLGQFIPSGNNRPETYLKGDEAAIERAALPGKPEESAGSDPADGRSSDVDHIAPAPPVAQTGQARSGQSAPFMSSPAVHVNVEIHIAADATAATVEEIFKNMRKYVLNDPASTDGS